MIRKIPISEYSPWFTALKICTRLFDFAVLILAGRAHCCRSFSFVSPFARTSRPGSCRALGNLLMIYTIEWKILMHAMVIPFARFSFLLGGRRRFSTGECSPTTPSSAFFAFWFDLYIIEYHFMNINFASFINRLQRFAIDWVECAGCPAFGISDFF